MHGLVGCDDEWSPNSEVYSLFLSIDSDKNFLVTIVPKLLRQFIKKVLKNVKQVNSFQEILERFSCLLFRISEFDER